MKKNYNALFIVDKKAQFGAMALKYDVQNDLVLTYDFALKKYITDLGGVAEYLDHLVDADTMQENNYLIYEFFKNWHYDKDGNDIFTFKNIPFGFSFRLEFWNDFVSYTRLYLSLKYILDNKFLKVYVSTTDEFILQILNELQISYQVISDSNIVNEEGYYFPIAKWLDSKIRPSGARGVLYKIREKVSYIYGIVMPLVDKAFKSQGKYTIFIQDYHPTRKIIQTLRDDKNLTVLLENFSRYSNKIDNLKERLLPISGDLLDYEEVKQELLEKFKSHRFHHLVFADGSDITESIYDIIIQRISERITSKLRTLDSCIGYLDNNKVDLIVLVANMGHTATLFDLACRDKGIPSYMIINGMLLNNFQDEAKYATLINSYSKSIKENYFRDMNNIVTLGDPRMDMYHGKQMQEINREIPTITIGASGFNPTDLNSYVAVEFDFMYDVLSSFSMLKFKGEKFQLIIKVRPNGYEEQYQRFVNEYFQDLEIKLISTTSMMEVLKKTDFYISIYSQTLFEASCLGIPVVYYKKDTEVNNAPFDNNSELVTVSSAQDLIQAYFDFKNKHVRYDDFLKREIMEQYIGSLDGDNFERNIQFIYELLKKYQDKKIDVKYD